MASSLLAHQNADTRLVENKTRDHSEKTNLSLDLAGRLIQAG
jgi:hypothetical protein